MSIGGTVALSIYRVGYLVFTNFIGFDPYGFVDDAFGKFEAHIVDSVYVVFADYAIIFYKIHFVVVACSLCICAKASGGSGQGDYGLSKEFFHVECVDWFVVAYVIVSLLLQIVCQRPQYMCHWRDSRDRE